MSFPVSETGDEMEFMFKTLRERVRKIIKIVRCYSACDALDNFDTITDGQ